MSIHIRDVLSFHGRDYLVEGTVLYRLGGKTSQLVRAVDGSTVVWVETPDDGAVDLRTRADTASAPPECIDYHRQSYVQRLATRATIEIDGVVPEHTTGPLQVWRYRAAGDLYLQIEDGSGRVFMMAGEAVPRGIIEHLPGR